MKPIILGSAVGLVLAYFIGYNQIYVRQQKQASLLNKQIAQEQAKQELQKETDDIIMQLDQYRARLPKEPDPSWIVKEAMRVSSESGIEIGSVQQDPPQMGKQVTKVSINLAFKASYHELGTFLDLLEKSDQFIHVDKLSAAFDKTDEKRAQIQLALSTIVLPSQLAPKNAAQPAVPTASQMAGKGP